MLSDSSDNLVAYRIVHMPDETKDEQLFQATTSSGSTTVPQQVQYFVIENSNGSLQAVQSPPVAVQTLVTAPTSATTKIDGTSNANKSTKIRSSIAIAPKATATKSNVNNNFEFFFYKFPIYLIELLHLIGSRIFEQFAKT